jgi:hypothetical protein
MSQMANARRRVRSSGNIFRKSNLNARNQRFNEVYYTSTTQYLASRNKSFAQNQYHFLQQGDSANKPGDSLTASNLYSSNGTNQCPKRYITRTKFSYRWLDTMLYDVNIPEGNYDSTDIRNILMTAMTANNHYIMDKTTHTKVFFLDIQYDMKLNLFRLICYRVSTADFSLDNYFYPLDVQTSGAWAIPNSAQSQTAKVPRFVFQDAVVPNALGLVISSYNVAVPTLTVSDELNPSLAMYTVVSSKTPILRPSYSPVYYKPSNYKFAQQGAVTAGSMTARVKYDTINTTASSVRAAYGAATANALAYGKGTDTYTNKNKLGFPMKRTPVISKYTGKLRACAETNAIKRG